MSTRSQRANPFDRRRSRVAARRPDHRDPLAALAQHVVEHPPDELQGDVLERQGRPVEQFGDPLVVADLDERHNGLVAERRRGRVAHRREVGGPDLVADERGQHRRGSGRVGVARSENVAARQFRPGGGDVEATVAGEAGEQRVGEAELGSLAAGRDVAHARHYAGPTTRSRASTLRTDGELAQLVHRRLHGGLLGVVGDEEQAGVRAEALLLRCPDAHTVGGEHTGDGVQDTRFIGDLEADQVLGRQLVDRTDP